MRITMKCVWVCKNVNKVKKPQKKIKFTNGTSKTMIQSKWRKNRKKRGNKELLILRITLH